MPRETYLALLRGINVGGKAMLPMRELTALFVAAGGTDVRTYIQSGNVIFSAADAVGVTGQVTREIAKTFGYPGKIILRTTSELRTAFARNPFAQAGAPPETLHVYFLNDLPASSAVRSLDPERSVGDSFVVVGREVFLHLPNGMARTKLTNVYFDRNLVTVSTARNWKTVGRLVEMMG